MRWALAASAHTTSPMSSSRTTTSTTPGTSGCSRTARVVDVDSVYDGSLWLSHDGDGHHLSDAVSVIETPGHAQECAALVVSTDDGTVVLTHAWWFADMTPVQDPLAWDQAASGAQPRAHPRARRRRRTRTRTAFRHRDRHRASRRQQHEDPAGRRRWPWGPRSRRSRGGATSSRRSRMADYRLRREPRRPPPLTTRDASRGPGSTRRRPQSVTALVPRARDHPRDERGGPGVQHVDLRGCVRGGRDYLDMAMSLSKPHPDAPYREDRREARRRAVRTSPTVAGRRAGSRWGRHRRRARACPTCSRATPPTTTSPRSTSSALATAPTSW
jgi:hypothetical protein